MPPQVRETPLFGNVDDFIDSWRNVDDDTRDITRVEITPGARVAPDAYLQFYGSCGSDECEWKRAKANYVSDGLGRLTAKVEAIGEDAKGHDYIFAFRDVELRLESGDSVAYQISTHFIDGSGRDDYVARGHLERR